MIETEEQARLFASASHFGCKMGCDEFMQWYHDPDVRRRIFAAAEFRQDNVNTAKDLRQDAWLEICQLPPDSSRVAVMAAAERVFNRIHAKNRKRDRKVRIILDPNL